MRATRKIIATLLAILFVITPLCSVVSFADTIAKITVKFNFSWGDILTDDNRIEISYSAYGGDTVASSVTYLNGKVISEEQNVSIDVSELDLADGAYTVYALATDESGNEAMAFRSFYIGGFPDIDFSYSESEEIVPSIEGATAEYRKVESLSYTLSQGTTSNGSISLEGLVPATEYEALALKYFNEALETNSVSGIPYQIFDVNVSGRTEGEIVIRHTGSTFTGERIAIKAYNVKTKEWDLLGRYLGSDSISASINIEDYSDNGTIHVAAILDYATNGSNTMLWSTDPQHYTKFADLNDYYYSIYKYAANEYLSGNIGYVITTGDLVDDLPNTSAAIEQWKIADKAMSYLDEAGVPNGLVSGNHDVGSISTPDYSAGAPNVDYTKYLEYFDSSRYNNEQWYGGSYDDNISHYDLITIGNVDFVVLYLGYGLEATDSTIQWANDILERYSHRVAIVATHEYLDATAAVHSYKSRADLIFDKIVDRNPNVKVVLCGHDDGSLCIERQASDGRTVYEILSDYQFVEAEDKDFYANEHYIGSVPECCGDGYIRLMTIEGNTLSNVTYSPVTNRYNPYGDRESFSIDLGDAQPTRFLSTVAFSAYVVGEALSGDEIFYNESAIVITAPSGYKTYHHVSYIDYPYFPEYSASEQVDLAPLSALIEKAALIETEIYTENSVSALDSAIDAAREALEDKSYYALSEAYYNLSCAIGALCEIKEEIDPSTLNSQYIYDLTSANWSTSDAVMTQLSPGIRIERASGVTNGWASVKYKKEGFKIKSANGRIYMQLSINADSAWSIYIEASQGNLKTPLRMNFAIDNAFNRTDADSYNGSYVGVYDVTEAFVEAGFDPTATISIDSTYLFIVPGAVDYVYIEYLTDVQNGEIDKTRIEAAIDEAGTIDPALYTKTSYSQLEAALENAKSSLSCSEQADVNLASLLLEQAISNLKLISDVVEEPEGSLIPADEGEWKQNAIGTMNIFRDNENYTILQNTNGQWPSADYAISPAYTVSTAGKALYVDITVAGNASFILSIDGSWVYLNSLITSNLDSSSGDIKAGSYTAEIPLSKLSDKESIAISTVRAFAVGNAGEGSAVTIRRLQIADYVEPPKVEDKLAAIIPDNVEALTVVAGNGEVTLDEDGITIVNNTDDDLRVSFKSNTFFDLDTLNALHLVVDSEIPFKMAYNLVGRDNSAAWPNTSSDAYSAFFELVGDRVTAGSYDVNLEIRDNCSAITDKSSVHFEQFIILVTGKGTFRLKTADMVKADTFDWPEALYGEPATPDNLVYDHAAKEAPTVSKKVDLIPYFNAGEHPIVSSTLSTANGLGLEIDISETPYLYYSFVVPEGSEFTFSLYSNSNYSPWLSYLDAQLSAEKPTLNYGAANWDSNTNRQQYTRTSQTGCIDMREYLVNKDVQTWIINQMKLYKSIEGTTVVSYLFFGSEDATVPTPDDPNPEPEPSGTLGDVNSDGKINEYDYILVARAILGTYTLSDEQKVLSDINKDGVINEYDYILIARHHFGTYVIE